MSGKFNCRRKTTPYLTHDFYDISVLESKDADPTLTKINLNHILGDLVLAFTDQFEEKDITPVITLPNMPAYVMADETMLKRVITNLISNAVRYGRGEFMIEVRENDFMEITFQNEAAYDRNIDISRLFEKCYTADISRGDFCSGLGLYIVKIFTKKWAVMSPPI